MVVQKAAARPTIVTRLLLMPVIYPVLANNSCRTLIKFMLLYVQPRAMHPNCMVTTG